MKPCFVKAVRDDLAARTDSISSILRLIRADAQFGSAYACPCLGYDPPDMARARRGDLSGRAAVLGLLIEQPDTINGLKPRLERKLWTMEAFALAWSWRSWGLQSGCTYMWGQQHLGNGDVLVV